LSKCQSAGGSKNSASSLRRLAPTCCVLAVTLGVYVKPAKADDYRTYYSSLHAKEMTLNWPLFYETGERRTAEARRQYSHVLDLAYGKDVKQKLDLYLPRSRATRAPVLLFVHGGSFIEGDRQYYGYIASEYVRRGYVVAIMSYRLTGSGLHYPAQLDDVKAALRFLYRNVARYGGDRDVLVVSGHSAGAILAAEVGCDRSWMTAYGIPKNAIGAIIGVSGKYRLGPNEKLFPNYVPNDDLALAASPIAHLDDPVPITLLAAGSVENSYFQASKDYDAALRVKGVASTMVELPGFDHQQAVNAFADPASPLFQRALKILSSLKRPDRYSAK